MIFNFLYRAGRMMALLFPVRFSYSMACLLADLHYFLYSKERRAIISNLKVVLGSLGEGRDKELEAIARKVFRNFAKYLVDFLRFSKVDAAYIKKYVKIEEARHIEQALERGKGVIILSAHIGNWELGGSVLGMLGYRMNAVVLSHKNESVNDFFIDQRNMGNFRSIEFGANLRGCYRALKNNELLALLGDRNFSNTGVVTEFFGRKALMPIGPAALALRTGAAIVPSYMIRLADDTFKFVFEEPIYAEDKGRRDDAALEDVMKKYLPSVENAVRTYPEQWYVFRDFWGERA
jgi:KDO2-lipid IV(A) lauroyltransferase